MSGHDPDRASERRACKLVTLDRFEDPRGVLDVAEIGGALPFVVRRFYVITDVPEGGLRGAHGHRSVDELLVAVRGSVEVELFASGRRRTVLLDRASLGLHLTPRVWGAQRFFDGAVLLVLASGEYDPADYLTTPEEMTGDVGAD